MPVRLRWRICIQVEDEGADVKPSNFKKQKEGLQKASAGNRAAWNTLFMRPDTVAEAVAAHYGISKSQLLDKEAAGDHPVLSLQNLSLDLTPRFAALYHLDSRDMSFGCF